MTPSVFVFLVLVTAAGHREPMIDMTSEGYSFCRKTAIFMNRGRDFARQGKYDCDFFENKHN